MRDLSLSEHVGSEKIFPFIYARAYIKDTLIYLHLSERHIRTVPNPLDGLRVSDVSSVSRLWRRDEK